MKRLFPKKGHEQDKLVADVKKHVRTLALRGRNFSKRAEVSRQNAKIALQRGEKGRARNFLVQYKQYQAKIDRTNNIKLRFERQLEAMEEGRSIAASGKLQGGIRDELKTIAVKADPSKIAVMMEETEESVMMIEEAGEILGGDPEMDLGIDVSDALNQLETELLLDTSGGMPNVPNTDLPQYISDVELEEEPETDSKENLEKEIERLKKELDS